MATLCGTRSVESLVINVSSCPIKNEDFRFHSFPVITNILEWWGMKSHGPFRGRIRMGLTQLSHPFLYTPAHHHEG